MSYSRAASESPREFGKVSGAMLGAQQILIVVAGVAEKITGEHFDYSMNYSPTMETEHMAAEAVACQTQTLALLEKIKAKLNDH